MTGKPNIWQYRPSKPALGNGRLRKALRIAYLAHDGPISTLTAIQWLYPRAEPPYRWRYGNAKRALKQYGALPLRRLGGMGRPLLWAPPLLDVVPKQQKPE